MLPDYADTRPFDYVILKSHKEMQHKYDSISDAVSDVNKILEQNPKEPVIIQRNSYAEDGSLDVKRRIWNSECDMFFISAEKLRNLYEEADNYELINEFMQKFGIESGEMLNKVRFFAENEMLEQAKHYHKIGLDIELPKKMILFL